MRAPPVKGDAAAVRCRRRAPLGEALRAVAACRPAARTVRDDGEVEPLRRMAQRGAPARAQRSDALWHLVGGGPLWVRAWRVADERGPRLVGRRGVRPLGRRAQPPPQRLGRRAVGRRAGAVARLGGEERLCKGRALECVPVRMCMCMQRACKCARTLVRARLGGLEAGRHSPIVIRHMHGMWHVHHVHMAYAHCVHGMCMPQRGAAAPLGRPREEAAAAVGRRQ